MPVGRDQPSPRPRSRRTDTGVTHCRPGLGGEAAAALALQTRLAALLHSSSARLVRLARPGLSGGLLLPIPDCRGCCNGGYQASHVSLEAGQWPGPDRSPVTLRTDTGTGKVSLAAVGPALTPVVASPGLNFFESLASPAPQPGSRLRSCISKVGSAYKCNICNI